MVEIFAEFFVAAKSHVTTSIVVPISSVAGRICMIPCISRSILGSIAIGYICQISLWQEEILDGWVQHGLQKIKREKKYDWDVANRLKCAESLCIWLNRETRIAAIAYSCVSGTLLILPYAFAVRHEY